MEIGVRVETQPWGNASDGRLHVATAYFVFVAIDESGAPCAVPADHGDPDESAGCARPRSGARTDWRAGPRSRPADPARSGAPTPGEDRRDGVDGLVPPGSP